MNQTLYKPHPGRQFFWFILAVGMMSMIGIISSDIYLPSMPYMATYFHTEYAVIQKTITVYLVGLAIFQLLYGPLSDHFGRKSTLQVGLLIYIGASIACTLSTSITALMIARFFQAIGACSGLVIGRCIISDIYDRQESANIFSIILPIVALSPAIAPVIGGYLQVSLGWRMVFTVSIVFGVVLFFIVLTQIKETLSFNTRKSFHPKIILYNNIDLLRATKFILYSLIVGAVYCSWFAYLADSSYIYQSFLLTPDQVGYCYISQSLASIIGTFTSKRIIRNVTIDRMILSAILINLTGVTLMLFIGHIAVWFFLLSITIAAFANGILLPLNISSAMSSAVGYNAKLGGSASGLLGFIQIGGGALGTLVVSFMPHTALTLSLVLMGCMIFALFMLLMISAME